MGKKILGIAAFCFAAMSLFAADYYVSMTTGNNGNTGAKTAPYKNLQKALNVSAMGDKIYVAEGNYFGLLDKGSLELKNAVEIYGGYSPDFSKHDVLKYQTRLMPPAKTNGTAGMGLLNIAISGNKKGNLIIDGLIFDKGDSNAYHASKGVVKGVEGGMHVPPPGAGQGGIIGTKTPLLRGDIDSGTLLIQNCIFNNASFYAIQLGLTNVAAKVLNNVFTANIVSAVEIRGASSNPKAASLEFAYNTVLFNWSRTNAMEDMGYGFRCMTGIVINVHHNIIGLSNLAGIDRTRSDSNSKNEADREIRIDNNMFFMNKQADLVLPGAGKFLRIFVDMFGDVDTITSGSGNAELSAAAGTALKKALNIPYLEGFLSATYKEKTDYDPNSPMNEARRALGLNQVGKIESEVSMFANRYPLSDSIKLFGVVSGYGAQVIK